MLIGEKQMKKTVLVRDEKAERRQEDTEWERWE